MMPQNQDMNQFTEQQGLEAQQQIQAALQEANLPAEMLSEIGQWAQRVISDPSQFPQFQQWLRDQGLPEEDIPQEPDYQELAAMAAIGHVAGGMQAQPQEPAVQTTGPVSPEQMQSMAAQGRMGDTMLAHINPQEAAVLESMGGVGTINPATGLPEYGFFSDLWKGIKKVAKTVAPFVLPVMALVPGLQPLIPALGTALGASAALAPIVGAAAIAGGVTALSGGSVKDVLTSAALTGLGAYLTPIVGKYVGGMVGVTSPALTSAIGSATLSAGMTALRGGTVSQILTSAATGAAANYLGQVASNAINSGNITNTKITQKVFDDAVFAGADAKGLADAGLGRYQITQTLIETGLAPAVAEQAAIAATSGQSADQIAVTISNKFAGLKAPGSSQPNLYSAGASGASNSVIGGANVKALETVQKYEDGMLAATEGKTVLDQARAEGVTGRVDLTRRVVSELTSQGVDAKAAASIADQLISNKTVGAVGGSIAETFTGDKLFGTPNNLYKDADFVAQQINDLAAQKLDPQQIRATLLQEGVDARAIDAGLQYRGQPTSYVADQITAAAQRANIVDLMPPRPTPVATETVTPAQPQTITEQAIAPGETQPSGPIRTTDAGVAEVDLTQQPAPQPAPQTAPPPPMVDASISEADMIALDATRLKEIVGNNPAAIQQNLEYAGVDPVIAAQAADMAVVGIDPNTIARAITDGSGQPLYTNQPGAFTSQGGGPAPAPTPPAPAIPPEQVGAIVATPPLTDTTPINQPAPRPDMGTFTPAPPDPSWSIPLQYPGMNPGLVGAGIRPAYETTSPVQSQYYWGRQPFFATPDELDRYGTSPFQPAQPFGIQQGYFEQPLGQPPVPVYGANLQPIEPGAMPTSGQIGGSEPLNQPIGAQQPVTPYEVNPYMMPAAFASAQQPMLPYNMYQYQMPAQPNYVYNIAPQAGQYSIPSAAPV